MSDGPHGVRRLIGHPVFPQESNIEGGDVAVPTASAVGASWDEKSAFVAGEVIARDCIQEGVQMILAPAVNMKRNAHCGRNFEYYSEDPYLSGVLEAAFINGVQSKGVGTSLKHYAVNNQEINRGTINAEVDERTLREYYLKVFEIILKYSNPTSVMCSYNKLNGIWTSENRYLLTELLKETWNYNGLVISDWGAVHDIAKCVKAGLDLQMPRNKDICEQLKSAIENKIITVEDVDRAAMSMLRFIERINNLGKDASEYNREEQHELAYKMACESITLLRNENNILPIKTEKYKKIAVVGEAALEPVFMGGGSSKVSVEKKSVDIPLDCLRKEIEFDYIPIHSDRFTDSDVFNSIGKCVDGKYDLVLCFVSNNYGPDCETEAMDRDNLMLPNYMNAVLNMGVEQIENFVIITQFGGAVLPYRWENAKAIVQMWYTGEGCGRAITDVLLGKVNPSGKLSETFMIKDRTDMDYPGDGTKVCYDEKWNCGYRYYDKHPEEIWFPFGHGISYTKFEYTDLELSETKFNTDEFTLDVNFKLKNVGDMIGKEVVQLYIAPINSIVDRPIKELKRFAKLVLQPDEEKTVSFTLDSSDFAYFNTCLHNWHVESGKYDIIIAASSRDIRLKEEVKVYYENDYTTLKYDGTMIL